MEKAETIENDARVERAQKVDKSPITLGTERIGKLLIQYATPSIIAMVASSLYNLMDSIFIGQGCGPDAIAGLAITFPFINLSAAFGAMVGVGTSTMISIKLGQKDKKSAESVLGNAVLLNTVIGLTFMVVCLLSLDKILTLFGASEVTIKYAREYMQVILAGNVITHIYLGLNDSLRATGYPRKAMLYTLFAVCINALFNYFFIFVLNMGIRGAAVGTVCAQALALAGLMFHFFNPRSYLHFKREIFHIRGDLMRSIISIGLAPFSINVCACLVVSLVNNFTSKYGGDMGVATYGIINRITFIFIMIIMGFNQGMQPIIGYNFGARQPLRVRRILLLTIFCAVCVTTTGWLLSEIEFTSSRIINLFTTDEGLITSSIHGLKIMALAFPLAGVQVISVGFFQSTGMAAKAIFLALTRQLIFLAPFLLIFPHIWELDGVWWSFPTADTLAAVVTVTMMIYQIRKFKIETT